ncbi:MAG: hypothetical protein AAFN44_11515 [Pseudomonadota bacterium]
MPYRLLEQGEEIQEGDQPLDDDCESWNELVGWEIGMRYNVYALKPIRRFELAEPNKVFGKKVVAL